MLLIIYWSNIYKEISSGKFHDKWFTELKKIILLIKKQIKRFPMKLLNY